ncbi:MAG: hypothetical protein ACLUQY_00775 [Weissella confusa]
MMLTDIEAKGSSLLDWRTTRLTAQTFANPATYIFNKKHYEQLAPTIKAPAEALYWEDSLTEPVSAQWPLWMYLRICHNWPTCQSLCQRVVWHQSLCENTGIFAKVLQKPTLAKVYKFARSFQDIALRTQYDAVLAHLDGTFDVNVDITGVF